MKRSSIPGMCYASACRDFAWNKGALWRHDAYLLIDTGNEGKREHTCYRIYLDGQLPPLMQGETNPGSDRCR